MRRKIELFSAKNPNPIISVTTNGTVLYSNEAGEPLLHVWGVNIGDKLPTDLLDFAQKVFLRIFRKKLKLKWEKEYTW